MKKYILFGAGTVGREVLRFIDREHIAYFCDNKKAGQMVYDIPIINYDKLRNLHANYNVVICSINYRNIIEISRQLYADDIPFILYDELAENWIEQDAKLYNSLCDRMTLRYDAANKYYISYDKYDKAARINSNFWQDIWAARHIFERKPIIHYDIGSRVDGLIAQLVSFHQRVCQLDIRPLSFALPDVEFIQCDATNMDNIADDSIESLSALCSLEHFGLGRYGDAIDPEACFKCFKAISRKIKQGGYAYISVPIGKEHLEFNAHRIFYASTIRDSFPSLKLVEFSSSYRETMEYQIDIHKYDDCSEWGGERFGLFRFQKPI